MKHKYFAILFLLMISVLTACSGGSESTKTFSQDSVTVKHDLGETKVKNNPKKVVVLELGFIDALLDAGIKPVGIADDGKPKFINENVREKIKGYTSVGSRAQPSFEKIASLKPDLIIADSSRHSGVYDKLAKIAPTIALKNLNADYQDTLDASLTIAKAVGKESAMEKKLAEHKQKLNELKQKFGSRKQSILLLGNTNEAITVRDENFFTSQLLTKIGYTYGVRDSSKGDGENGESVNIKMTLEQLLEKDPDTIVLMTGEKDKVDEDGKRPIEKDPLWKKLSAVKNGKVYEADRFAWSLRRSIDGADALIDEIGQHLLSEDQKKS
ncbi:ABC transporter substrate-binding protein [Bacillus paralicheniformis]|jgi:iron complex transport system substrate-binding protein|uniref:ABC transporter substrate-binding protein n=1 Tax=Bacillus paralicheniformis TaxID=1648923 RepID=UPI0003423C66|nr:ABC transporter substrate-binding protein [Bacillus paralicheniformis]KJD53754.1 iron-dicitrate ABC transporter substrate-binding protein [Bacillus amyloliquefaciens]KUL06141.1 iron-dicitrate ABC transporter substrate-binding protein [Bacillus licheniformis LMG 7559]AGN35602.1 iron/citrate ABC transporter substrate-binding protein YhfQ [Bacillus paralicheniformis ATCC 9945a]ARA85010.1 iron-dicitrate ABC transporter substrate-binding protein [Bacillus paralicheniformis]AYQ15675.1 iron-dicitr